MFSLITFQCRECGLVHKVLIQDNHKLRFSTECGNHSELQCITESRYFRCILCKKVDNTRKFENVYC